MKNIQDSIIDAKETLPDITPTPPGLKAKSSAHNLKSRLEWGEPALTILDIRDREAFNNGHIVGSMPMPMDVLVKRASDTIDKIRDIYVYGESDEQTAQAAQLLREAGFRNVAELSGGLDAWKAIGGPTDGAIESLNPTGSEQYNVVSQVSHHLQIQRNNR